ncbi:MAG: transcription termination/antitermination factor NusG [Nitrospirae bacterium GWC2_57_13]|jgi:transcription termination/antitermination protein NusG|nr:MAG: transcription termination/antitermination factor NusG [Nitrospirae bacterium GWC1_57_7]OGW27825.1 MAG: transcription termination/antitermination factor NusG [Nitrospirae bacterium GWC2_57_13]OGW45937.1 MAG: transcription termination/antitermination factor NusG [Nitrospirae bacterium GWD2_57_8]
MKNWYAVHTYAGFENKVRAGILETVSKLGLQDRFGQILVPTEEVLTLKGGKKRKSQRKFFPGYILVEMELDDSTWHIVKETPKVTGFVGGTTDPTPLSEEEVGRILKQTEEGAVAPVQPKDAYQKGDRVRVIDGPFSSFIGTVEDVSPTHGRLRVMVSIFGRSTPVELEFLQVEREIS